MAEVSKSVGEASDLLNDQVDGFGAAVGDPVGVEVGQYLAPPGFESAAEAGDLGDWAAREGFDHPLRDRSPTLGSGVVGRPKLLVALPCHADFEVRIAGSRQASSRAGWRSVRCSTPCRSSLRIR